MLALLIQSFFFISLLGFQQILLSAGLILAASLVFLLFPRSLLIIFSSKKELLQIGEYALRVISLSFVPAGITIVATSHLQGLANMKLSVFVIVFRQVVLLVPLVWILYFAGLKAVS